MKISSQVEGILFFSVLFLVIVVQFSFMYVKRIKKDSLSNKMITSILLSFGLYASAFIWWGFFASDGFSQVFGWILYAIIFVLTNLVVVFVVLKSRKSIN
ncbi:hypothetical protein IM538_08905 [Cytobacillus suaedae]|nr:hypothetical protein IM538_08905 [Cytobacillus suaedae]